MANPISKWFGALTGRPQPASPEVPEDQSKKPTETKSPEVKDAAAEEEDSVATDIKTFRSFTKRSIAKLSTMLKPYAKKGGDVSSSAATKAGEIVDKKFLRKLVRIFLILFFLLILIFVAIRLFKTSTNGGNGGGIANQPTPTPINYEPYKPSVYADDPVIKKLEEDINVLEGEISGTNIRETDLNPPTLDFNISF